MVELPPALYEEALVPAAPLPPLFHETGPVDWAARRIALLELFASHVYGRLPATRPELRAELVDSDDAALGGTARRRQFRVEVSAHGAKAAFDLLVYLPPLPGPAPVFLGLNFYGNHTTNRDPAIRLTASWVPDGNGFASRDNRASAADRGRMARRWPVELALGRGYGVATVYCGDLVPDFAESFELGVHPVLRALDPEVPAAERPGAIAAWAWGLSRALDVLAAQPEVDATRVAVIGHSRLGKAALWAGATDERFALVVSNESGCGGAALSRRRIGERLVHINTRFPHWFAPRFRDYNEREETLPVDQHQLLALIAPRALAVGSAAEDRWADPRGEFLALRAAEPVWEALGQPGLPPGDWPALGGSLAGARLSYHLRAGQHDIIAEDWRHYLDLADRALRR